MKSPWYWGVGLLALAGLAGHARGQDLYALRTNDILRITPEGVVSTFASVGGVSMAFNGTGALFVSKIGGGVDEISRGGTVSTFVSGIGGNLAFNSTGTLYVADSDHTISAITPGGVVSPFATGFNMVKGLAVASDTLYAADYGNAMVYAVSSGGGYFGRGWRDPHGARTNGSQSRHPGLGQHW